MKIKNVIAAGIVGSALLLTGCASDADRASQNISTAADNFEVERRITVINNITDQYLFVVEGRCSIDPGGKVVVATCKHAPDEFRKHYLGLADNTSYIAEQLAPIDVDEYRFRIVLKPETVIPNVDLETSIDAEGNGD